MNIDQKVLNERNGDSESSLNIREADSDEVKQELHKDEHGNFFIVAHDAAGVPYYRPFRLMSNTAVTSIEMRTHQTIELQQPVQNTSRTDNLNF